MSRLRSIDIYIGGVVRGHLALQAEPRHVRRDEGSGNGAKRRFRVKTIGDDYLVCRTWDGTNEGGVDINVAKPWDLRYTPFHGQTVNGVAYSYTSSVARSATPTGGSAESQVIVPPYFTDCEIVAERGIAGGTGVSVGGSPLKWQDSNCGARAWARKTGT